MMRRFPAAFACVALLLPAVTPLAIRAEDRPQWGERYSRNMISDETGLPDSFDPGTRNRDGGIDLPEGGGRYATLAGFVTSLIGRLPEQGERIRWGNLELTVEQVRRRRIQQVRLRLLPADGEPGPDQETPTNGRPT